MFKGQRVRKTLELSGQWEKPTVAGQRQQVAVLTQQMESHPWGLRCGPKSSQGAKITVGAPMQASGRERTCLQLTRGLESIIRAVSRGWDPGSLQGHTWAFMGQTLPSSWRRAGSTSVPTCFRAVPAG